MPPRKVIHYLPGFKEMSLIPGVAPYLVPSANGKSPDTIEEMAQWPIHYQFNVKTVYAAYPDVPRVQMDKTVYRKLDRKELIATLTKMGIPLPEDFAVPQKIPSLYLTERKNYIECAFTITHRMCAERYSFQIRHTLASYHSAMVSALKLRATLSRFTDEKGKLADLVLTKFPLHVIW